MKFARRRQRRAIAGIVATVIMFAILFTVGTSYFIFVNAQNASYVSNLLSATNKVQGALTEGLSVGTLLESNGDIGFTVNNTSSVTVNMTAVLVISSTGTLLRCDGVGFPAGAGCSNTTPTLWSTINAGAGSTSFDTGYVYVTGTTDTIKVLTARGNTFSGTYPSPASQSTSSQAVTVSLDNLRWVQLIPAASSLVQKNFVANCNSASCAATYSSSVTAGNILVDAVSWPNQSPPASAPTDTLNDHFTLGSSASVAVPSGVSMVQNKYTSNCNAASCGLAFSSNVASGHTLVYAVGWANQSPPSAPTDTRGDSFTLGSSQSVTVNPPTPAVVQHRYLANCSSATCALAYSSSVTAGNTLVFGLGWPSNQNYNYVPVTVYNCQSPVSLAMDGSATGSFSSTNSGSVTLTTNRSNDVVVVVVASENGGGSSVSTVSSVSGGSLTWSKRSATAISSSPYIDTEVWYAIAPSALSAASITVTLSGNIDDATLVAFGVSGANTTAPWDTNGALPAAASSTGNSTPTVTGVSTSNANDMVLGFNGIGYPNSNSNTETAGSGFTLIQDYLNTGGNGSSQGAAEYKIVSSTQSATSVAFGVSNSDWITIADAIQQGTGCGSTSLGFDGSAGSSTESSSTSASLTTAYSNDVIILSAGTSSSSTSVSSVSDTGGHTWTHRSTETGSTTVEMEEWYTVATSPLSSDSITVTWSASGDNTFSVFGISGANTASPFDSNAALPAVATGTGTNPSVSVSTSNANDIIFGLLANEHTSFAICHTETDGTGFTDTNATQCALGSNTSQNNDQEYEIVSSTQTNLAIPYTTNSGGSNQWAEIGDAVKAWTGAATPTTFQEMVTWNPSTYSAYESSTLGNVRFCADSACATPLHAWLESCTTSCSNRATSATAWVKLTSSISSGGSTTIYMVFEPTATNFDGNYWGEAPNLSSTYGQYDNGANVFTAYFNGNTALSSFSVYSGYTLSKATGISGPGGATINAIEATGYKGNNPVFSFNTAMSNAALITESSFSSPGCTTTSPYTGTDTGAVGLVNNAAASSVNNDISANCGYSGVYFNQDYQSGGTFTTDQNPQGAATSNWLYATLAYAGPGASSWSAYIAPQLYSSSGGYSGSVSNNPISGATNLYLGQQSGTSSSYTLTIYYNFDRARAYPPNGIMPTTSFGSTTAGTGSPTSVSDTLGDSFTQTVAQSATVGSTTYESAIWYATASSSGADTITATFSASIAGSVSIYEITGYSTTGVLSSTGSSTGGSTSASVGSFTPSSNSFVVGNVETGSTSTKYTVGTGYTTVASGSGGCDASDASQGCNEYETGLGSATTAPFTLSASTPWVDVAASFTPLTSNTYYSYIWYATAGSSGADTISASFSQSVAGSVSIYEISGVTSTGLLTSTGSSTTSQGATSVASITPSPSSVVIGNAETSSTTYSAGSGYTLSGSCSTVGGCGEYQTGVGSATTVPLSISPSAPWVEAAVAFAPVTTSYYSYIWYATAATSGTDTVTATFGASVTGSVSIYEITGYTTSGALSSTGSSYTSSTTASVASFNPASDSFIVGAVESPSSVQYTAGSTFTLVGTCNPVYGCSEYNAGGGGSANTVPLTLGTSAPWVEAAMSFSTPFNQQSGIQVNGYPTMGVSSGASLAWEVTFTNVDPQHRPITIWPQTEMAIGSAEYDGFDTDYTQAHYYIIDSLNSGSTTVNGYTSTTHSFITLAYDVPTVLYFASTAALGSTTQAFGTNVLTPFEAYFALTGIFSDGTLFGETIPYPYGIITQANAFTTPTAGATGNTITVSCTSPCHFTAGATAMVGWINSAGQLTQLATFTMNGSGNIPSGVTFQVPTAAAGYYTIEVTDYINSVFMTFQHT